MGRVAIARKVYLIKSQRFVPTRKRRGPRLFAWDDRSTQLVFPTLTWPEGSAPYPGLVSCTK
eukprot:4888228-Heterocapsa_arctica.AAC.1